MPYRIGILGETAQPFDVAAAGCPPATKDDHQGHEVARSSLGKGFPSRYFVGLRV